jgi:transglutaminase-like putative cysteine protease|tara:strand:- start:30 stop:464 length:435 start_codon:yes stop_codon:yes gene_type:complete
MNGQENKPFYKTFWFYVIVIPLVLFVMGIYRPENNQPSKKAANTMEFEPLEYKLAIINKDGYVSKNDITVTRFRYLLDNLERKCTNTREDICDVMVYVQKTLREKYGREASLLAITEGVNDSIPNGIDKVDCAEIAVAYMQLLK